MEKSMKLGFGTGRLPSKGAVLGLAALVLGFSAIPGSAQAGHRHRGYVWGGYSAPAYTYVAPAPVYVAPPPVYYAPPPPVYYAPPPPVYYAPPPPPVYYGPPGGISFGFSGRF